ncbi:TetR/AcrR family transcriptional regulator [Patulibacter minatonensis]|uniref:TetR/AcrR family transcriptional regulator n=1 Tax=Patulibacter minatonensis TaxID=298163 RepID=UPI0006870612|nr:TetR/AcrR family transcriptional regulator [Patulibacter minatonensis]
MTADDAVPDARAGGLRKRESEVLDAAVAVFWSKGYAAATIQDVADRIGVLKGSLYYYIESKEGLLERLFDEINRDARAILADVSALDAPPLERLRAYVERYTAWYLTSFERVSIYFSEWHHLTGERRAKQLAQRAEFELFVRGLIAEARDAGAVDPEIDVKHASFFLLGGMNSAATWYSSTGTDSPERIAASHARMAVGLLRAP